MAHNEEISQDLILGSIHVLRGERVILDDDLARIYGESTKRLNQQVRRNRDRFPQDFVFVLTPLEHQNLKLQIATSSSAHGGRRKPHLAFTEHGAIMAANVLRSPRAVQMSILVVRAFVSFRRTIAGSREIERRLKEIEEKLEGHDADIRDIVDALRQLLAPATRTKRSIGY